jgi:hypothetical protein
MRRKHRHNQHLPQPLQRLSRCNAHPPHLVQRPHQRPSLPPGLARQLQRRPPPLAVVGLRQIDQFKVEAKRARQQQRPLHGQRVHQFQRTRRIPRSLFRVPPRLGVAPPDGPLPQRFHMRKKVVAGLLPQYHAQQRSQRTHIAPQRRFFQLAGPRFQLRQPLTPTPGIPQ